MSIGGICIDAKCPAQLAAVASPGSATTCNGLTTDESGIPEKWNLSQFIGKWVKGSEGKQIWHCNKCRKHLPRAVFLLRLKNFVGLKTTTRDYPFLCDACVQSAPMCSGCNKNTTRYNQRSGVFDTQCTECASSIHTQEGDAWSIGDPPSSPSPSPSPPPPPPPPPQKPKREETKKSATAEAAATATAVVEKPKVPETPPATAKKTGPKPTPIAPPPPAVASKKSNRAAKSESAVKEKAAVVAAVKTTTQPQPQERSRFAKSVASPKKEFEGKPFKPSLLVKCACDKKSIMFTGGTQRPDETNLVDVFKTVTERKMFLHCRSCQAHLTKSEVDYFDSLEQKIGIALFAVCTKCLEDDDTPVCKTIGCQETSMAVTRGWKLYCHLCMAKNIETKEKKEKDEKEAKKKPKTEEKDEKTEKKKKNVTFATEKTPPPTTKAVVATTTATTPTPMQMFEMCTECNDMHMDVLMGRCWVCDTLYHPRGTVAVEREAKWINRRRTELEELGVDPEKTKYTTCEQCKAVKLRWMDKVCENDSCRFNPWKQRKRPESKRIASQLKDGGKAAAAQEEDEDEEDGEGDEEEDGEGEEEEEEAETEEDTLEVVCTECEHAFPPDKIRSGGKCVDCHAIFAKVASSSSSSSSSSGGGGGGGTPMENGETKKKKKSSPKVVRVKKNLDPFRALTIHLTHWGIIIGRHLRHNDAAYDAQVNQQMQEVFEYITVPTHLFNFNCDSSTAEALLGQVLRVYKKYSAALTAVCPECETVCTALLEDGADVIQKMSADLYDMVTTTLSIGHTSARATALARKIKNQLRRVVKDPNIPWPTVDESIDSSIRKICGEAIPNPFTPVTEEDTSSGDGGGGGGGEKKEEKEVTPEKGGEE